MPDLPGAELAATIVRAQISSHAHDSGNFELSIVTQRGNSTQRLNVVIGPNGSGKSNLYRALRLLADTAQGRIVHSLAREGGLPSTVWAGPEVISAAVRRGDHPVQGTVRKHPVSLRLGFASDEFGYLMDLGLPAQHNSPSAFTLDPEIKRGMHLARSGDAKR
jgi:predicted ATPase